MSLAGALSSAITGLQATTAMMQLTSNNIANAQTPGFTEKSASLSSVQLGGFVGGVAIASYSRATNTALTSALNTATSTSSYLGTQNNYLTQLQTYLGSNSSNPPLSAAIANFQSAWTNFQSAPESQAEQTGVIQAGSAIVTQIQSIATGVATLTRQVKSDIGTTVTTLNSDLSQIAALNLQISQLGNGSQTTGGLEDQRDQLINQVSQITNVVVMPRDRGQVAVYTSDGVQLVDGAPATFSYDGTNILSAGGNIVTNDLIGGSLQAQVQFLGTATPTSVSTNPGSQTLSKLTSQLSMLAYEFTNTDPGSFAAAYDGATGTSGELASGFFTVSTDPSSGLPDATTLQVNSALINGTATVKLAAGSAVNTALTTPITYPPTSPAGLGLGLNANSSGTYTDMGTAIISYFQQAANAVSTASTAASQQQTYYQQGLSNATGVSVDSELVNLTTLQNSYAASAHVISTINAMFQDLAAILS